MINQKDVEWLGYVAKGLTEDPRYSKTGERLTTIVKKLEKQVK